MSLTNSCRFVGNLTKDPEGRDVTVKGEPKRVVNFSLAVNTYRKAKGRDEVPPTYVDFEVWDKAAEAVENHLAKGDRLSVDAEYKVDTKENDGVKSRYHKFRVNDFEIVKCKKRADADATPAGEESKPAAKKAEPAKKKTKPAPEPEADEDEDGIPF